MNIDFSVIGKGVPRNDAVAKATGHAKYGADISMPGMLFGKVLRSPHPHAKILHIDIAKAKRLVGVKDVVTGKDFPGHKYGFTEPTRDQTPLAMDKVRYIGDEIAAVAAIDEDTAEEALDLIKVDYEMLPAVFDPEEAIKDGAPLIHNDKKNNISSESHFLFGDIEEGFREADYVDEDVYRTQAIKHGFLEPHATLAYADATGKVTLWGNKQSPYIIYRKLSMGLNIPLDKLRIIQTYVGAGFGSARSDPFALDFCSILMAQRTSKPVKFTYTMRDVFVMGEMRHPFIMYVKTGVKRDGRITAIQARNILDGGAYSSIGPLTVALSGFFMIIPYRVPHVKYDGYRVYTNKGFCGSLRGHGIAQMRFALGSQLDKIALEIGMDPVQIHRINALQPGDVTAQGYKITSCGLTECLDKAAAAANWQEKKGKLPPYRGIGIGASSFCSGVKISGHSSCTATIKMNEDGKAFLATGATDIGQGSNTILAQIAAEVLGIKYEDINVNEGVDTDLTPVDPGSYSSRVTFYAGNAVKKAAENVKSELTDIVATYLGVGREAIAFKERRVFPRDEPKKGFMMDELIRFCQNKLSKVIIGHASWDSGIGFIDFRTGKGNMSAAYTFAADVVEVEVDPDNGKVKILEIVGAHDVGRVLNPVQCVGQLNGAYVMAQGQLLYEDLMRRDGMVLNPNFRDYKIPTFMDIGEEYKHIFVETNDPLGPFGAKEVGEGASVAIFPALANAIYDAIGVRIKELPITPEKILKAIKGKKQGEKR